MSGIIHKYFVRICCATALVLSAVVLNAQTDPGPRGGPAAAGGKYPTLNATETGFFTQAQTRFQEVDSVSGAIAGESGSGLGPALTEIVVPCAMPNRRSAAAVQDLRVRRTRCRTRR